MKIYVTRYALTRGILEYEGKVSEAYPNMAICESADGLNREEAFHGNDWHRTLDEARKRARTMRQNKINSLRVSIQKLSSLTFEGVTTISSGKEEGDGESA